jgi:hypothetical protein
MPDTHFFNETSVYVDATKPPDPKPLLELLAAIVPAAFERWSHQRGLASLRRSHDVLPLRSQRGGQSGRIGVGRGGRPGA